MNGLADDLIVLGVLELDGLEIGRGQRGCFFGERAVRQRAFCRLMDDAAGGRLAFGFADGPGLRGGGDEHLAAGGADAAQRIPIGGGGSAATGALRAVFRFVEIGLLDADVFPIDVELIGDDHGEMGLHTLTDLRILGHDSDDAIGGDAKERGGQESSGRGLRRLGQDFGNGIEMESDEDASAGDSRYTEKTSAIEKRGLHRTSLLLERVAVGGRCDRHGWYCNAV